MNRENDQLQTKEALLRKHYNEISALTLSYLADKERSQAAIKAIFRRAFAELDAGADSAAVSLKLHGYALDEIMSIKQAQAQQDANAAQSGDNPPAYAPPESNSHEASEQDLGPEPYKGPSQDELNAAPTPHEITVTPQMKARRRKRARAARAILIFNIFAVLLMLWVVLGLLRRVGVFPNLDLGYLWFNDSILRLF